MIFEKKKTTLQLAQEKAQTAVDKTNEKIEELGEVTRVLYDELTEIQTVFDSIRNIPGDEKVKYEKLKEIRLNWKQQAEKIESDYRAAEIKNVGAGAAGAGLGAAVVTMGPTLAMGVATTFGVASTGTAISTLSGAAATNAALAWLGGGALAAGGGGMAAGNAFLAMAGPIGWAIAGTTLVISGLLLIKTKNDRERIEKIFQAISVRDIRSYNLAIVELNERIGRISEESVVLADAIDDINTFGTDYNGMTEQQQYALGAYVNLMNASTQLLVNPIEGLQPKFAEEDYKKYLLWDGRSVSSIVCVKNSSLIVSLANFLYRIDLDDRDRKLLWKTLRSNEKLLEAMNVSRDDFTVTTLDAVDEALKCKYLEG